ncbi:3702_t:CDS:2, partial [Dentiscutata erythropus]
LIKYKCSEDPYNMDSFYQFKRNLFDFWKLTSGIGSELSCVAIQIYGICDNSASPIILNEGVELKNKDDHNVSSDKNEDNKTSNKEGVEIIYKDNENRENQFEDEDDYIFSSSEWDHDFSLAGCTIHPADDKNAKWPLESLCISNLELPSFLGNDQIFINAK